MTGAEALPRYCSACGARFEAPATSCPECSEPWSESTIPNDITSLAALLSTMQSWLRLGLVDRQSLARLRSEYEGRLSRLHAGRVSSLRPASGVETSAPSREARPQAAAKTVPPQPPFDLADWVARRQADILLYLGAFLLVISALIFVSAQRETLATGWRVGLLVGYTVGFLVAGLLARRWARVREAGQVFIAIGALFTPLNFVILHTEVLADRAVASSVVWLAGSSYCAAFYGVLFRQQFGRLYAIPAAIAVLVAWGALFFVIDLPGEWFGAWWMTFAASLAVGFSRFGVRGGSELVLPLVIAAFALLASHVAAANADELQNGPLPVTYWLLTAGVALSGVLRRLPAALLATTAGVVATSIATLWAFDVGADWYAYPPLIAGALAVSTRRLWAHWSPQLSHAGWVMAGLGALSPLVFLDEYAEGAHGAVALVSGATVLAAVAWRNVEDGALAETWAKRTVTLPGERVLFGWAAFAMLLGAIAYAQREFGVSRPDTGWSFAFVAGLTVVVLALMARREERALPVLVPLVAAATLVSLQPWDPFTGHNAILLGIPAVELLAAFAICRHWSLTVGAAALALAAAAAAWDAADWEVWSLALAYAGAGAVLFGTLAPRRRYEVVTVPLPDEHDYSTLLLSWGPLLLAPIAAAIALAMRATPDFDAPATAEYRVLIGLLMLVAVALAIEGWRLGRWEVQLPALAIGGAALAAAWPIFEFEWWTLAAAYGSVGVLLFLGLTTRRQYASDGRAASTLILSWAGFTAATVAAAQTLTLRIESVPGPGPEVTLVEYRALIGAVLLFAPALAFEGRRLRERHLYLVASAVLVSAILMMIAIAEPSNVQAYTIPVALYLAAIGLVIRRSPLLIDPHLQWHELVLIIGAAMLVLPQAAQGFEPGGSVWALVLLAEGALFLALAFTLGARWLAVSGVLTLSGVAIRALYVSSEAVPYWLMLGIAGLILLAVGVVLLLEREWWDRSRQRVMDWWARRALVTTTSADVHVLALLSTLAPAVLAIVLPLP